MQRSKVPTGTYFADWVTPSAQKALESDFGEVKVTTTLDRDLQRLAIRAIGRAPLGKAQAALVAMRPDGRVVAMVGGKNYADSPFNRVTQARRQPGSAFKLFVYLAALRAGWTPDSMIDDKPITIDGWSPLNSDRDLSWQDDAARSLRSVEQHRHRPPVRSGRPRQCHPRRARPRHHHALARQAEHRAGNGGGQPARADVGLCRRCQRPLSDRGARTARGRAADRPRRLLPPRRPARPAARLVADARPALSPPPTTARASARRSPSRPSARPGRRRKTATRLFIGFAGDLVVGVWVGRDDNQSLGKVSGGTVPADIWRAFMVPALARPPSRSGRCRSPSRSRSQAAASSIQSPLPPEWSNSTKSLRELANIINELATTSDQRERSQLIFEAAQS